ncbi:MAG: phosphatidylglycerol:prolipoprotein diacylglycerol transferase [Sulfurimonas sp.]|jgi:phosphatidylglycerol:prolipoprotein diacylglycerol transferase|uniref:prolipoprotein diacylglyceryl transferase n=1 Tax=Sulfurimonas sp. TaxID=2022749 RepID=UPI0039E5AAA7
MEYFEWNVSPILLSLGGFSIHWYGALFAAAILSGFGVMNRIYKHENKSIETLESLQIYMVIGIVIGARLGHCLFYDPVYYFSNPLKILAINEGGLASHGGGIGAILATLYYAKKNTINFIYLLDRLAIPTALFAFFVRMGNLMNSEILGIQTDVPWAIVFSRVDLIPRHPAQLYEAIAYLSIFIVLSLVYIFKNEKIKAGFLFGLFLSLIFTARIAVEFVKERQASYSEGIIFSTGQMLSVPFLLLGLALIILSFYKKEEFKV